MSGMRTRFTMNPGMSREAMVIFPNLSARATVVA